MYIAYINIYIQYIYLLFHLTFIAIIVQECHNSPSSFSFDKSAQLQLTVYVLPTEARGPVCKLAWWGAAAALGHPGPPQQLE